MSFNLIFTLLRQLQCSRSHFITSLYTFDSIIASLVSEISTTVPSSFRKFDKPIKICRLRRLARIFRRNKNIGIRLLYAWEGEPCGGVKTEGWSNGRPFKSKGLAIGQNHQIQSPVRLQLLNLDTKADLVRREWRKWHMFIPSWKMLLENMLPEELRSILKWQKKER